MDNVFEILIYLIIIISFLSSIFKKKKQQQQKPPVRQTQPEEYYQTEVSVPQTKTKDEYDILKELEVFFKVGTEPTKQEIPIPQEQPKKMTKIEEHTLDESWHTPTASEHTADDWEHKKTEVKKRVARVDTGIEEQAAKFEESLVKKKNAASDISAKIRIRLRTPSSLKEYVIISEILGKPKALRR
jgi:hypothetical protein